MTAKGTKNLKMYIMSNEYHLQRSQADFVRVLKKRKYQWFIPLCSVKILEIGCRPSFAGLDLVLVVLIECVPANTVLSLVFWAPMACSHTLAIPDCHSIRFDVHYTTPKRVDFANHTHTLHNIIALHFTYNKL